MLIPPQVSNIASQNFKDELYVSLAKAVKKLLTDPDIKGVLVTHGTDTMAESAFFVGLVLRSKKPIVFVGSTRPANGISADGRTGGGKLLQAKMCSARFSQLLDIQWRKGLL